MSDRMIHSVEFYDVLGIRNLIAFSSRAEAEEFIDLGLKKWHFSGLKYHYYSTREFAEEKIKSQY